MSYKFYVKDCPEDKAVHDWISNESGMYEYVENNILEPKSTKEKVLKFSLPDIDIRNTRSI